VVPRQLDRHVLGQEALELLIRRKAVRQRAERQRQDLEPAAFRCDEDRKAAAVERRSRPELESRRRVLVVADEDEGRAHDVQLAVDRHPGGEHSIAAPRAGHRDGERGPLAAPLPLLGEPFPDHAGIDAQAGVVDEDAPVEIAHVDVADVPGDDRLHGLRELQRNAGVLREVVQRAAGNHSESRVGLDGDRGDRTDRAVSAGGDQHVATSGGLPRARGHVAAMSDPLEPDGQPGGGEARLNLLARIVTRRDARLLVDENADPRRARGHRFGRIPRLSVA
jgi:hypothetical protein